MRSPRSALAIALFSVVASVHAQPLTPGNVVVLDVLSDPLTIGAFGAAFEIGRGQPPELNALVVASSIDFVLLQSIETEPSGQVLVVDSEADPGGFGADPNSGLGRGAIFRLDPVSQGVSVLSDGQNYLPGLPPATPAIFVDPSGLAVDDGGAIFVCDPDADPSQFGPDPNGLAGYGAVFSVDPLTGAVDLIADGANYPAGLPVGEPSVFVDPVAVAVSRDGSLLVLDVWADPLAVGAFGSVFRVLPSTGEVTLVSSDLLLSGPFDLTEEITGDILVSDFAADPFSRSDRGALFRIDPGAPDPTRNASVVVADAATRLLGGVRATGSGHIFLVDSLADGLSLGRTGTVWEVDPATGGLTVASSSNDFLALNDVAEVRSSASAPSILSIAPSSAAQGELLTVTILGSGFDPLANVRLGAGIAVVAVNFVSPGEISVDIDIDLAAVAGLRDLIVGNPDLTGAALNDGFTVIGKPAPAPGAVNPPTGAQGDSQTVTVSGAFFDLGATVDFGTGVQIDAVRFVSSSSLDVDITILVTAIPGFRDVTVTNPDPRSGTLMNGFEVTPPLPPVVVGVIPPQLVPGTRMVTIEGDQFRPGASVDLGSELFVTEVVYRSATSLDVWLGSTLDAVPGFRDVTVTNPDFQSDTLTAGLEVVGSTALRVVAASIAEVGGNGDGAIDPGETVDLVLTLVNRGNVTSRVVEARLGFQTTVPGVVIDQAFTSFPDAPPGAVVVRPGPPHLGFTVGSGVPCGTALIFEVTLDDDSPVAVVEEVRLVVGHGSKGTVKPRLDGRAGDRLGTAVASAGDIDGDGAEDFIVGSPFDDPAATGDAGTVFVVSGATGSLLFRVTGGQSGAELGSSVAGGVDVDGDGVPDIAVGVPGAGAVGEAMVVSGATGGVVVIAGGSASGDRLGASVALGDVDGDGRGDLLVGSPGASFPGRAGAGRVDVWSGRTGLLAWTIEGLSAGDAFGSSLGAGDIDGDGLADALIGSPGATSSSGRVEALSLAAGLLVRVDGVTGEMLGASIAYAGDANGDGFGDLVAGAPGFDPGGVPGAGRAVVLSGDGGAILRLATGTEPDEALGRSVGGGRDMDGDGYPDVIWSSPGSGGGGPLAAGRVVVTSVTSGRIIIGHEGESGENAGSGGVALLDRLGDGVGDLLIGSPGATPSSQLDAGSAYVVGRDVGCSSPVACTDDGFEDNDTFVSAGAIVDGRTENLMRCPADEDWFRFDLQAGESRALTIQFDAGLGDLDLYAYDSLGSLVDLSAGSSDEETVTVSASIDETFRVRVVSADNRPNAYSIFLRNPSQCDPTSPPAGLFAVPGTGPDDVVLTWDASADPCHEPSVSAIGYRVYAASSPHPVAAPNFPSDPSFTDITLTDGDGSSADPHFDGPDLATTLTIFVVVDVGTAGGDGPAGHW